MSAEIIRVTVRQNRDGWFVATSEDLPGLFVAHPDEKELREDIPDTIKALYKAQYDREVAVLEGSYPSEKDETPKVFPWVTIPSHLAAVGLASPN